MNQVTREQRRAKDRRKAKIFGLSAAVVVAALVGGLWTMKGEGLDGQGCPRESGPNREIIVLLDTSDPLSDKHRAELNRILREMTSPTASTRHSDLAVRDGERVSFYLLQSTGVPASPIEQICNPGGNPAERKPFDALVEGAVITKWRWEEFVNAIQNRFPTEDGPPQPASPLLETIAVITARHAPSQRSGRSAKRAHLIVISDLLQHTAMLSHYGPYPKPDSLPRELAADLSQVNVSMFRLERKKYEKFQSPEHFYWWTDWVEEIGGRVVWQQAM